MSSQDVTSNIESTSPGFQEFQEGFDNSKPFFPDDFINQSCNRLLISLAKAMQADKLILLVRRTNKFRLGAILNRQNDQAVDFVPISSVYNSPIEDQVPLTVLFQSYQAKSWVRLSDLSDNKSTQHDPYFLNNAPASLICLPVFSDQELKGFVYAELAFQSEAPFEGTPALISSYMEQAAIVMDSITQLDCLKQQLREQTDELNTARQKLKSSKKASSQYFDELKHEIRSPLNTLMGFSQLLVNKSSDLPQDIREYAKTINAEGSVLTEVLDHILAISKFESEEQEVQKEEVDLKLAVKAVLQTCRSLADKDSIKLKLRTAVKESAVISVERTVLNWFLKTVVGSSLKHALPGSQVIVTISKKQQGPVIEVHFSELNEVKNGSSTLDTNQFFDIGLKFNERICERLNCSFERLDHQGASKIYRIEFMNQPNQTCVKWKQANQTSVFFSPDNTVVVYREEADSDRVLDSMLKEIGLSPTVCDTSQQLMNLVSIRAPQTILLDIHLIRRSRIIDALRQSKSLTTAIGQIPLIIISNDTQYQAQSFSIHGIEIEILPKPLKLNQLILSLKPLLNKSAIALPFEGARSEVKSWKSSDFKFVSHSTPNHSFSSSPENIKGELRQLLTIPIYKGGSLLARVRKIRESAQVKDPSFLPVLNKIEKAIFEGNEVKLSDLVKSALAKSTD